MTTDHEPATPSARQTSMSPTGNAWDMATPAHRHVMADGRRAVLAWVDGVGTVLQLVDVDDDEPTPAEVAEIDHEPEARYTIRPSGAVRMI